MTRTELKELLKNSTKYTWIGIRGVDEKLNIGEVLDTSYRWDYENDQSSYGTENEEDLGGVCATDATTANWANFYRDEDDIEDMIDLVIERINYNKSYSYNYRYIIASNSRNPYNYEENDEYEAILEDAIVLAEIK